MTCKLFRPFVKISNTFLYYPRGKYEILLNVMSNNSWIKSIGNGILDLVYPPGIYCISCGKITDSSRTYGLCNDCMQAMNWITERHCSKCGRPLADTDPGGICFSCRRRETGGDPPAFDKGHVCAAYGACEQAVIFALKYGSRGDIGTVLGEILYDRMTAEYEQGELADMYDMAVPVPIYREKQLRRGFNHAAVMAGAFAKRAGIRFEPDLLIRTANTRPMKGLAAEERRANISGAFAVRERKLNTLAGARVLLIDDIFTTGSTIDEIASLLKHPVTTAQVGSRSYAPDCCCRHEARSKSHDPHSDGMTKGAARVDFLAYAAAGDMIAS